MKSLVVNRNGQIEVIQLPKPTYNSKQCLLRIVSGGICGTDETLIKRGFKGVNQNDYPIILGHEAVGIVEEVGEEVISFKKGDIVTLPFNDDITVNEMKYTAAWGGFCEYGIIHDVSVYSNGEEIPDVAYSQKIIPESINPIDSTMIVTLREVYSAIKQFDILPGKDVVIFGSGPVALSFINLLKLHGVKSILGVAISEEKKETLSKHGATYVVNSQNESLTEKVWEYFPNGADYTIDAVGSSEVINQSMKLIKDRGSILSYGVPNPSNMNLDWAAAPYNWNLKFQQLPYKSEEGESHKIIINWIEEGKIDLKSFIADYYHIDNAKQAFEKNRQVDKKVIITF